MSDWNIIGHEWAVRALAASRDADRIAHAYLFAGPHGIGKTTLARALAQALQCQETNAPCGVCNACKKIARDRHPDVVILEGVPVGFKLDGKAPIPPRGDDRERRTLRIDQIRALQHDLALAPFEGKYKIVILRRFEEANEEASNAFLKTLEEPPPHVRLILTARDASLLLPTITSRCQTLALRPLPIALVESALIERWQVARATANLLAHLSSGRMGWAVSAAADPTRLEARKAHLEVLTELLGAGRAERFLRAEKLASRSEELPGMLEEWLTWWRDILLVQGGDGARITNIDRAEILREHAVHFELPQVKAAIQSVLATARYLHQNVNARLALEVLVIDLPGM